MVFATVTSDAFFDSKFHRRERVVLGSQGGAHDNAPSKVLEHILQRCRQHLRREVCG